jgi:hypothetical protein
MGECALEYVGNDLHVTVPVRAKAHTGLHDVFIDHAQAGKTHVLRIVIIGKRKAMPALKPAVMGVSAFAGFSDGDHEFRRLYQPLVGAIHQALTASVCFMR